MLISNFREQKFRGMFPGAAIRKGAFAGDEAAAGFLVCIRVLKVII
jgi:hypothetical protein